MANFMSFISGKLKSIFNNNSSNVKVSFEVQKGNEQDSVVSEIDERKLALKRRRDREYYRRKRAMIEGISYKEVDARIRAKRKREQERRRYCQKRAEMEGISYDEMAARIQGKRVSS